MHNHQHVNRKPRLDLHRQVHQRCSSGHQPPSPGSLCPLVPTPMLCRSPHQRSPPQSPAPELQHQSHPPPSTLPPHDLPLHTPRPANLAMAAKLHSPSVGPRPPLYQGTADSQDDGGASTQLGPPRAPRRTSSRIAARKVTLWGHALGSRFGVRLWGQALGSRSGVTLWGQALAALPFEKRRRRRGVLAACPAAPTASYMVW